MTTTPEKESKPSTEDEWFSSEAWPTPDEPPRSRRFFWTLQILLFGAALLVGLFPYLKSKYPGIERVFQPAKYHQRQGHLHFQKNHYFEAIEEYKKALLAGDFFAALRGKERSATLFQIARCHVSLRNFGRAIHYARKAIQKTPGWMQPYILVMDLYTQLNQADKFEEFSTKLQKKFPDNWQVSIMMGNGYSRLQESKKAIQAYNQAIESLQSRLASLTPEAADFQKYQSQRDQLLRQLQQLKNSQRTTPPIRPIVIRRPTLPTTQRASYSSSTPTSQRAFQPTLQAPSIVHVKAPPLPKSRIHRRSQRLLLLPFLQPRQRKSLDKSSKDH